MNWKVIFCEILLSWRPVEGTCALNRDRFLPLRPRRAPLAYWTNNWWFGKYYFLKETTMSTVFDPKKDLRYLLLLWLWRVGCMFSGILLCRLWLSFRSTVSSNLPQWGKILPQTFFGHNEPKCIKSWLGVLPDSYFILQRLILYSYKKCLVFSVTYLH